MEEVKCMICYDTLEDQDIYSFIKCYDKHTFCYTCTLEMVKHNRFASCPIDKIENQPIKRCTKNEIIFYNTSTFITEMYLKEKNSKKADQLIKVVRSEEIFPLNTCITCLNEVRNDYMYGLIDCSLQHRSCFDCIIEPNIARWSCSFKNQNPNSNTEFFLVFLVDVVMHVLKKSHIQTLIYLMDLQKCAKNLTSKQLNMEIIHKIISGIKKNGINNEMFCIKCFVSIDKLSFGFESCKDAHRFCERCMGNIWRIQKYCPFEDKSNGNLIVIVNNKHINKLNIDMFLMFHYLKYEKAILPKEIPFHLSNHNVVFFSKNVCINCSKTIKGEKYKLENCVYHYFCLECMTELSFRNDRCPIDGNIGKRIYISNDKKLKFCTIKHVFKCYLYLKIKKVDKKKYETLKIYINNIFKVKKKCIHCNKDVLKSVKSMDNAACLCWMLFCKECKKGVNLETDCAVDYRIQKIKDKKVK